MEETVLLSDFSRRKMWILVIWNTNKVKLSVWNWLKLVLNMEGINIPSQKIRSCSSNYCCIWLEQCGRSKILCRFFFHLIHITRILPIFSFLNLAVHTSDLYSMILIVLRHIPLEIREMYEFKLLNVSLLSNVINSL